jgi:hypothetical protein
MAMAGVQEENRLRIALALLGLGAVLILIGVALGVQHYHRLRVLEEAPPVLTQGAPGVHLDREAQVKLIRRVLFVLVVLVGILAVSLTALRLWSRRFKRVLLHKPAPPTPDADVWAMHQLPEDATAELADPPPDTEPEKGP